MSHLTHAGWTIDPDFDAPYYARWTAQSVDGVEVCAPYFEALLDEMEAVEGEMFS